MPNTKKHYRWRAYLDDFKQDADGKYVYTGKQYEFAGDAKERKSYFAKIVIFSVLALIGTALPECFPPVPVGNTAFTLIPWILQTIAVLVAGWSVVKLFSRRKEMREYIYKATVKPLPVKSMIAAVLSLFTMISQMIYLFTNALAVDVFTAVRIVGPPLTAAAEFLLFFTVKAGKWEEK